MNQREIQDILEQHPQLADKLYCRGFLLTAQADSEARLPFLRQWTQLSFGAMRLFVHPKQKVRIHGALCLVGHAYDPVEMQADEALLLSGLERAEDFFRRFNQLTGVFTLFRLTDDGLQLFGDPTGMQSTFYSIHGGVASVSSHTMLLGTLLGLDRDPYVERLTAYRFFPLLGNSLPGDLTQFSELKRLVPNHSVCLSGKTARVLRFYTPQLLPLSKEEIVRRTAALLHANLRLIAEKWKRPAISMTGGCDSKTTLACAAGLYERFSYFSYISSAPERLDAEAAARICASLGLPHHIYEIPASDSEVPGAQEAAALLRWNAGDILDSKPNDVRKRVILADPKDFDVEVKSWASELGRAYYSKRFNGRTDFGNTPTPRACTTLYKFFLHNRRLVRETDRVFAAYLEAYFKQDETAPLPWQEQFFWEFRMPSWNGPVITAEHRYAFDITVPYNNRLILELLLSAGTAACLHDEIHAAIRQRMNPKIDQLGIAVQNAKHTARRARLEALYYSANHLL